MRLGLGLEFRARIRIYTVADFVSNLGKGSVNLALTVTFPSNLYPHLRVSSLNDAVEAIARATRPEETNWGPFI